MEVGLKEFIDYTKIENLPELTDVDIAFGGAHRFMIPRKLLPEVDNKWHELFSLWFYGRIPEGKEIVFDTKEHLTLEENHKYHRFIKSVMASFAPKHEHKEDFVSYMLSIWLNDYSLVTKEEADEIRKKTESASAN